MWEKEEVNMKNAMLAINFWNESATPETKKEFMEAIDHENALMSIQLVDSQIDALQKKINNANSEDSDATEEEKEALEQQMESLKKTKSELEEKSAETKSTHDIVVDTMSEKNENHFGNDSDTVRTILRVLASWDNSKLIKYAIIPAFQSPDLYNALEAIHVNSTAGEDGELILTDEVKSAYKQASQELERIIKVTFSLPFETPYTTKTRVKLTAEDKKLLNDCYIKGFSNKFDQDDETGRVTFKKRQLNKLVKEKKNKKTGKVEYDYSGLATTISNIVIKHYFA